MATSWPDASEACIEGARQGVPGPRRPEPPPHLCRQTVSDESERMRHQLGPTVRAARRWPAAIVELASNEANPRFRMGRRLVCINPVTSIVDRDGWEGVAQAPWDAR